MQQKSRAGERTVKRGGWSQEASGNRSKESTLKDMPVALSEVHSVSFEKGGSKAWGPSQKRPCQPKGCSSDGQEATL